MKFIDVPVKVLVKSNQEQFEITSLQSFDETEDKVTIMCVEYVPQFKRGFVCDLAIEFKICESEDFKTVDHSQYYFSDLVLVYIPKKAETGSFTQFEYIFYK